jgi:hypothetical protein
MSQPIACTLDAEALPARLAEISALGRDALISFRHDERTAELRFRKDLSVEGRLNAIVAAESACCSFLTFTVVPGDQHYTLRIEAPAGGESAIDTLVSAFTPEVIA